MRTALTVGLLFVGISLWAQTDSLELALKKIPPSEQRVELLNKLGSLMRDKNNRQALSYSQEAFKLSDSLEYNKGKALSLENLGWILYRMGDYTQSLSYSLDALKINEVLPDSGAVARCLNNVGAIGFEDENYNDAIVNFKKALAITRKLNDRVTGGRSLNNLSLAYFRIKSYDSSEYFARQALKFSFDQPYLQSYAYRMLGDLSVVQHRSSQALENFNMALELGKKAGNTFMEASILLRIGNLFTDTKEYEKAKQLFNQTITISKKAGYKNELEGSYNGLSKVFEKQGDLSKALFYKTKYAELHDSLRVESHRERLAFLQYQHGAEIEKANVKLLTQQQLLNEQTIRSQRQLIIIFVSSLAILILAVLFVVRANRKKTLANQQLALKSLEIKKQADELSKLNHSKDKLFQLLSHDLRGPVGNVKNVFDMLTAGHITQEEFKHLSGVLKPALDNLYLDLNNLLNWSKSQLSGIQTNAETFPIAPVIRELVERTREMAHQKKLAITEHVPEEACAYADRDHFISIVRNLLSNALKFSNDSGKIRVEATSQNGHVRICVRDEGVGLTSDEIDKIKNHLFFTKPGTHRETGTGIGLILVNEFLKANKGFVEISSEQGQGAAFTIVLPTHT
jgi:signal transduction histidine kinase